MTKTITTEFGREFRLSMTAIEELRLAKRAREADDVFDRLASDVPCRYRNDVWQSVDDFDEEAKR